MTILVCPLFGKQCVGVERCAPAVFSAAGVSNGKTETDMDGACPIVVGVGSLAVLSVFARTMLATVEQVANVKDASPRQDFELPGGIRPDQDY